MLPMDRRTRKRFLISLPAAGAMRGFLNQYLLLRSGEGGEGENYGLVFNAPLEAVADAFPELAPRETINGHLRRLLRLSDETRDRSAGRKTLADMQRRHRDVTRGVSSRRTLEDHLVKAL